MTPRTILLTALLLTASTVGSPAFAQGVTTMKTWNVAAGRFTVAMPVRPEHESDQVRLAGGAQVTNHVYTAATPDDRYAYSVIYADLPVGYVANLDQVVAGWRKTGTQKHLKPFTFDGRPGRYAVLTNAEGYQIHAYAVTDGQRLYQIIFTAARGADIPAEADQFVHSFRIESAAAPRLTAQR